MKGKVKTGKRFLAILSAAVLGLVAIFSGIPLTLALTTSGYSIATTEMDYNASDSYEAANAGSSLLRNTTVSASGIGVDKNGAVLTSSNNTTLLANLTSGTKDQRFVCLDVNPNKLPLYISYDLGQAVKATGMAVIGDSNWGLGEYELYIGDSRETLFTDSGNLILHYTNSSAGNSGVIKGYFGQSFTVTGDTKPTGSFFGIKIISENIDPADNHLRFRELMLFGEAQGTPVFNSDYAVTNMTKSASASYMNGKSGAVNHLAGIEAVCLNNQGTIVPPADPANGQTVKMVDNSFDTRFYANVTPGTADPMPVTISYDMGKTVSVDEMAVMGYSRLGYDAGLWQYELYAADTRTALFSAESLVASYQNEEWDNNGTAVVSGYFGQSFAPKAGKTAVRGRYFGIKILNENNYPGGENVLCISELAVYGAVTDEPFYTAFVPSESAITYLANKSGETNLLAGKPVSLRTADYKNATLAFPAESSLASITNGIADTGKQCAAVLTGTGVYPLYLTYDMRAGVTVSELAFISRVDLTDKRLPMAEYEVFVSDNSYDLYSPENRVAYYDNAANIFGAAPVLANLQVITFPEGQRPTGRYYGVRFLRGDYQYNQTIMGEIAVYGAADPIGYSIGEQTVTTDAQLAALGTNLLTGYTPTVKDASGAVRPNPTNGSVGIVLDGSIARASSFAYALSPANNVPMTFAYKLDKQAVINKLFVASFINNYAAGEYEIYISSGSTALFSRSNLVAGHSSLNLYPMGAANNDIVGTQVFTLNTPKTGAYIGIKVLQPDDGSPSSKDGNGNGMVRLTELGAYGTMTNLDPEKMIGDVTPDGKDLTAYQQDLYLSPVWEGDTVYHETAMFYTDRASISLLYPIKSIIGVRSYDLKTCYTEGVDYKVVDGKLERLPGSAIPLFTGDVSGAADLKLLCPQFQISVTYSHDTTWSGGYAPVKPESRIDKLPNTYTRLKNKQALNVVFYGDSITVGWNASGLNQPTLNYAASSDKSAAALYAADPSYVASMNIAPYMPSWPNLVVNRLKADYGYPEINMINKAVSSSTANWGAQNIDYQLNATNPDLVVIGFGMNGFTPGDPAGFVSNYKNQIAGMIADILTDDGTGGDIYYPNAEILLVSRMTCNNAAQDAVLNDMENELEIIAAGYENVAVAPVSSVFTEIAKSKRYIDYTGNNINHPNDFGARIYAQTVLAALDTAAYQAEVDSVVQKINAIGSAITPGSGGAIAAAKSAYDKLSDAQKGQAGNLDALISAQAVFENYCPVVFGAQIRATGIQGLRFGTRFDKTAATGTGYTLVGYGTVMLAKLNWDGKEALMKGMAGSISREGAVLSGSESVIEYGVTIINIPQEHYSHDIMARSYLIYENDVTHERIYVYNTQGTDESEGDITSKAFVCNIQEVLDKIK